MTMKRFIVRLSRTIRGTSEYALSQPWYMFVLGLLVGMGLIAVHDRQDLEHLRKLTTTLAEQRVVEHPVVAQPVAKQQPTRTYYPLGGQAVIDALLWGKAPNVGDREKFEAALLRPDSEIGDTPNKQRQVKVQGSL